MRTPEQARRADIAKEVYVTIIGWVWMVAGAATLYFLVSAIFFGGSWWSALGSAVVAWVLYRVSLYYLLEKEATRRAAANSQATNPPTYT